MKRNLKKLLALLLTCGTILTAAGCGQSSAPAASNPPADSAPTDSTPADSAPAASGYDRTEKLTLRWGFTGTGSENDCQGYTVRYIADYVAEKTGGMITIDLFPGSQLGAEGDMLDQVMTGNLDLCLASANTLTTIWPEFSFVTLPFAFPDLPTYWATVKSDGIYEYLRNRTTENQLCVFIGAGTSEFRGCNNSKHPVRSVDDFKGLNFRVMSGQIYTDLFTALGASVATIPASELYSALQQGVVNAEDTSKSYFYDNNFYEIEKYCTELNAIASSSQIMMSYATWEKLSDYERQLFLDAALDAETIQVDFYNETNESFVQKLEAEGVSIVRASDLSSEERQGFVDATAGIWDSYSKTIGEEFFSLFEAARSAAWAANGYS